MKFGKIDLESSRLANLSSENSGHSRKNPFGIKQHVITVLLRIKYARSLIIWIHYRVNLNLLKLLFYSSACILLESRSVKLQIRQHQFIVCTSFPLIKARSHSDSISAADRYVSRISLIVLISSIAWETLFRAPKIPRIINIKHGSTDKRREFVPQKKELMSLSSGVKALKVAVWYFDFLAV